MDQEAPQHIRMAIEFVKGLFRARHFSCVDLQPRREHKVWQMFSERKETQEKILAVLTTDVCKSVRANILKDVDEGEADENSEEESEHTFRGSEAIGRDFIKSIVDYCEQNKIGSLVLISDGITSRAKRELEMIQHIQITTYNYTQTCAPLLDEHILQPREVRLLNATEQAKWARSKHMLPQINVDDALIKWFGFREGEMIIVYDQDESNVFEEIMLVARDHDLTTLRKKSLHKK